MDYRLQLPRPRGQRIAKDQAYKTLPPIPRIGRTDGWRPPTPASNSPRICVHAQILQSCQLLNEPVAEGQPGPLVPRSNWRELSTPGNGPLTGDPRSNPKTP